MNTTRGNWGRKLGTDYSILEIARGDETWSSDYETDDWTLPDGSFVRRRTTPTPSPNGPPEGYAEVVERFVNAESPTPVSRSVSVYDRYGLLHERRIGLPASERTTAEYLYLYEVTPGPTTPTPDWDSRFNLDKVTNILGGYTRYFYDSEDRTVKVAVYGARPAVVHRSSQDNKSSLLTSLEERLAGIGRFVCGQRWGSETPIVRKARPC